MLDSSDPDFLIEPRACGEGEEIICCLLDDQREAGRQSFCAQSLQLTDDAFLGSLSTQVLNLST